MPLNMLTRRSSLEDKGIFSPGEFLRNDVPLWPKRSSRQDQYEPVFHFPPSIAFTNMLESCEMGEGFAKINDNSMVESGFLKSIRNESKKSSQIQSG